MAQFVTFAEVLTEEHVSWHASAQGITGRPPGTVLQEILDRNGGRYETELDLRGGLFPMRGQARLLAGLPGNEELDQIADLDAVPISLEHLRGIDPRTRLAIGYCLTGLSEQEQELLNRHRPLPRNPGTKVDVTPDPERPWRVCDPGGT
jgi:hypothetical protein